MKYHLLWLTVLTTLIAGCATPPATRLAISQPDPNTGYFPTRTGIPEYAVFKGDVLLRENIALDERKALLVADLNDYYIELLKNIGYFEQVVPLSIFTIHLQQAGGLAVDEKIHNIATLQNAFQNSNTPFWFATATEVQDKDQHFLRLEFIDPESGRSLLVAQSPLNTNQPHANNALNTHHPIMNAVIEWIRLNSSSWQKSRSGYLQSSY